MNTALQLQTHQLFAHLDPGDWLDILHQDRQRRQAPLLPESTQPQRVRIHTLGRFSVMKDGQALVFPGRAKRRPMDLLKMVIALGGREVCQETLSDILWPDAEGDIAQRSLETTLHRLRKLLGADQSMLLQQGRVTLNSDYCWVDCWAFERLQGRLDGMFNQVLSSGEQRQELAMLAESALGLYKGPFLGATHWSSWSCAAQQRLHGKYTRLVRRLGEFYQRHGQWRRALENYERGLELDGLQEEFCQGAMECCMALDLGSRGVTLFNRFRRRLHEEMAMAPGRRTEALVRRLRG